MIALPARVLHFRNALTDVRWSVTAVDIRIELDAGTMRFDSRVDKRQAVEWCAWVAQGFFRSGVWSAGTSLYALPLTTLQLDRYTVEYQYGHCRLRSYWTDLATWRSKHAQQGLR